MQELDDNTLLREYAENGSEEAFAALVARHVNKVYSVALRHTRNPDQAEEITQAVFVILAKKSRHLGRRVILSGWLYQTARLTAVTLIRSEIRRARRDHEAHMQTSPNETDSDAWRQVAPLLDSAMAGLSETDRHAVVLRFFDGKSMREVGAALGGSEDAAKMRVNRAVEKLRQFFTRRGVVLSVAVLTAAISANSVQAAPAVLAKSITAVALTKGLAANGSTLTLIKGALKIMAWTKIKIAVVTVGVIAFAATTAVIVEHQMKPGEPKTAGPVVAAGGGQLAFAGYATPEATIKSMLWATSNGDSAAFLECLTPEAKLRHQKLWAGRTPESLTAEGKQQFAMVDGLKIIDRSSIGSDHVIVTVQMAGNGHTEKFSFIKINGDWKLAQ